MCCKKVSRKYFIAGEEYLQHVMYERLTKCEELKTSDIRQEEFQKNVNFGYVEVRICVLLIVHFVY